MSVTIEATAFGLIIINGESFGHDVLIRLSGKVKKRKKKLSTQVYDTSHLVSLAEAEYVYEAGCETVIVGSGQYGILTLSDRTAAFFAQQGCGLILQPTPDAIKTFNQIANPKIGLFHVTC